MQNFFIPLISNARSWFGVLLFMAAISSAGALGPTQVPFNGSIRDVAATAPAGQVNPHRAFISRKSLKTSELNTALDFEIALKMRNFAELQDRVAHGERISPEEMAAKYNPTDADYKKVTDWLTAQGFQITYQDKTHLAVFASGNVSRIQNAMHANFARVTYDGSEYTSAVTAPDMPSTLSPLLVGINGLQPHIRMHKHAIIRPNSLTGTNPPFLPSQLAQAYGAGGLYASSITGTGQSIAIVIDTFPKSTDLQSFWSTYGVSQSINNITFVQVVAGTLPAPEGEETLDTEWSSSIAPGAKVRVYASKSLSFTNLDLAYQKVYSDVTTHPEYGIHQMSMSYGIGETYTTASQVQTDDQYFAELASAGVTVFASSGDSGSTPGPYGAGDESGPLQACSPASDPYVTSVGGTSVTLASNGTVSSESIWNNSYGAGGGGVSEYFTRPYWQTGSGMPSGTTRLVPDVASAADPLTGAVVIINGSHVTYGGTSWSSPVWAGFCALFNQNRASVSLPSIGLLGPYIYPQNGFSSFRDITSGSNATSSSAGKYAATTGYDMASGLGVPNVQTLAQTLRTYSPILPHAPVYTSGMPTGTVLINTAYSFNLTASGYPAPSFTLTSGSLPPGISLASTGLLSGTPTQAGIYTSTVTASNGVNPAATLTFSINVQHLPSAPVITNGPPPATGTVSFLYGFTYAVTGYPAPTFSVSSGSLPPGLTLSSAGVLSGTPTQAGTYTGTIDAGNGVGSDATQNFSIVIQQAIASAITNGPPPAITTAGNSYNFTYTSSGYPAPSFTVTSGALPPGLTLTSAGVLSGTPTQAGLYTGTVSASNGFGSAATQAFSIAVQLAPTITNAALSVPIAINTSYHFTYTATGYPAPTFSVTTGALPPGMTLSSAGVLSGSPTQLGSYTGTITATNSVSTASQSFTITVQAGQILAINLPTTMNESDPDGQGTVVSNVTSSSSITITLTSSNTGALTIPASVVIPAGQTSVALPYTIIDNLAVYGTQTTTVNAHASGWTDGNLLVTVTDNKTTDNWSTYGNGPAHAGVYPGPLLGGVYSQAWSSAIQTSGVAPKVNQVAVSKGLVYVTPYNYPTVTTMFALNAATGAQVWQHAFTAAYSINPPTVYKGNVYVERCDNGGDTNLWSLNATTGTVNWNSAFGSQWENYLSPTVYQTVGIWMDGGSYGGLYGFNFDGSQKAFVSEAQVDEWTPTYYNGTIYSWVSGTFKAINPATGATLWSATATTSSSGLPMNCAAPIVNNLAFLDGTQALTAVNVSTHATAWSITGNFVGTPAVSNGVLYVISGSQVKILNASTGASLGALETLDSGLTGQPVLATDSLLVSSTNKTYLFNLQSGALVQTIPYGGPISVAGGSIYLAGTDGTLRVFTSNSINLNFASNGAVGLTAYGYTAAGQTLNATLGFAPTAGTVLTVINNTSPNPINGTFSNLPNGGTITLTYNGTTYLFTANYSGGDGNDLTLTYTSSPPQAPTITDGPPPGSVAINTAYSFTYTASGYPVPTFSVTSGNLPPGLSLSGTGVLSGTPTQAGTYSGTVTATNATGSASQNFTIVVQSSVMLSLGLPATLNEGDADSLGTVTLNATFANPVIVQLTSSNTGALTVPSSVVIPAGQSSVTFPYTIVDNLAVYGTQTTTVSAQSLWAQGVTQLVTVTDNKTTDNWSSFGNGQTHTGVYAGSLLGNTYAQAWSATFPSTVNNAALNQVAVAKGIVYVTPISYFTASDLTAVDAGTGSQLWQYVYSSVNSPANGITYYSINPPTVYKGSVYVQQGQGLASGGSSSVQPKLWSFNARTGQVNWTANFGAQWEDYLAPTIYQSIGIWMDGGTYGGLYGMNFDGSQKSFTSEAQYDGWTPTYYNGTIYTWVGSVSGNGGTGTFSAINPATGGVIWTLTEPYTWQGWSMNCAVPIANNIAFLNGNQSLTAVNVATYGTPWSITGVFKGTPAVSNGLVYVISGSQVMVLNANTGATVSTLETHDTALAGQPVVSTDALIVSSSTSTYLFNLQSGALVQTIPYGGPVSVAGGNLYLAGSDGTLRVYQPVAPTFTFASASTTGLTTYGYNVGGRTLNVALNFIPAPGTVLTLINNTGPNPISGTFANLPNDGTIDLTYNGATFTFTANYAGGDGNDLTLTYTPTGGGVPTITDGPPPSSAAINVAYSFAYTASGYPTPTFSLASGSLPPGITLSSAGLLSGTPTQSGSYNGTVSASNGVGPAATQNFSITITATLTQWENLYLTGSQLADPNFSGASAIPLKDGVPNLLKYFFNISPASAMTTADRAALPVAGIDTTTSPGTIYLTLTYRENKLANGLTVNVQESTDLQNWQNVTPNLTQHKGTDPVTGDPIVEVEVETTSPNKEFLRLNVVAP